MGVLRGLDSLQEAIKQGTLSKQLGEFLLLNGKLPSLGEQGENGGDLSYVVEHWTGQAFSGI